MRLKNWREVIFDDWPKIREITERAVDKTIEYARRYLVGDMRLATRRVYVDAEYEAWRERVLSKPLP